jgi:hypothetical protein
MSLDIYLYNNYCNHCGRGDAVLDSNMTHNVTPMWKKAGVYDALYMSHGHKAQEYIMALENGVADFESNYEEYKKLDSPNGWGLAKHALPFLKEVLEAFRKNPDAVIGISK